MLFRADNDPHVIELKRFSRYYDGNPVFLTVRASSTGSLFNTYSSDGTAYTQVMAEVAALMPSILIEVHAGQFQSILPLPSTSSAPSLFPIQTYLPVERSHACYLNAVGPKVAYVVSGPKRLIAWGPDFTSATELLTQAYVELTALLKSSPAPPLPDRDTSTRDEDATFRHMMAEYICDYDSTSQTSSLLGDGLSYRVQYARIMDVTSPMHHDGMKAQGIDNAPLLTDEPKAHQLVYPEDWSSPSTSTSSSLSPESLFSPPSVLSSMSSPFSVARSSSPSPSALSTISPTLISTPDLWESKPLEDMISSILDEILSPTMERDMSLPPSPPLGPSPVPSPSPVTLSPLPLPTTESAAATPDSPRKRKRAPPPHAHDVRSRRATSASSRPPTPDPSAPRAMRQAPSKAPKTSAPARPLCPLPGRLPQASSRRAAAKVEDVEMGNVPAISTQCTHEEDPECDESECEEDTSGAYEEEADAEDEDEDHDGDYRPAKRTRGAAQPKFSSSTPPSHKRKPAKPKTCGSSSQRPKKGRGGGESAEERRCSLCSYTFTRRSDLQRHMALHEEERVRNFCEFCGKGLSRPDALRRHLNTNITCKEKKNAREGKGEVEIVLGRRRRA